MIKALTIGAGLILGSTLLAAADRFTPERAPPVLDILPPLGSAPVVRITTALPGVGGVVIIGDFSMVTLRPVT